MNLLRRPPALAAAALAAAVVASGCGSGDEPGETTGAEAGADLEPIKDYLTEHSADLAAQTEELKAAAAEYHDLAESVEFDYEALLGEHGDEVTEVIAGAQETFRAANPAYEEMEGIVAGVPELAEYDVILDAGSSAEDDPASAVPFDLELDDGTVLEQPGNFFFLTETALFGTNPEFAAKGVEPDLDGDGRVEFGEALPDAKFLAAATSEMDRYSDELDAKANEFVPDEADAMGAVVIMTPTMSEYFGQWKESQAIAGKKASEQGFVAASRLADIADILEGIVFVYEGIEPAISEVDRRQAEQTGRELDELLAFAEDLRDREAAGEKFTAEQADLFGSDAQERAEAIAAQVSQAAAKASIELPEA